MKIKILGTCTYSISILTFSKKEAPHSKTVGGVSRTNDIPYM
jgi:hypothetical protein